MSFFDSEIVRAEMVEIHELQEDVYENFMKFPYMNNADRNHHINQLSKLIEKQKIVYARLSLSDDPDAKEMKEKIMESAKSMGLPADVDVGKMFDQMSEVIGMMKKETFSFHSMLRTQVRGYCRVFQSAIKFQLF